MTLLAKCSLSGYPIAVASRQFTGYNRGYNSAFYQGLDELCIRGFLPRCIDKIEESSPTKLLEQIRKSRLTGALDVRCDTKTSR